MATKINPMALGDTAARFIDLTGWLTDEDGNIDTLTATPTITDPADVLVFGLVSVDANNKMIFSIRAASAGSFNPVVCLITANGSLQYRTFPVQVLTSVPFKVQ